ncbi:hypothetical protein MKW94_011188 [Papaver nudicaule]|uniref:AIPP2-like SPOC-like domain-containing protein n=1 Tax=Papaver nudicaule TaxID=74823 RepID=A0AA41V2A7_PAPNU|nr:hypothetical protein [Papaver nudicaule]
MGFHGNDEEDCVLVDKDDVVSVSSEASDDSADSTTSNSNQVAICQKCGVRGYANLLIYCDVCHVAAEHTYCLDTLSKIDKKVETWSCGECVPAAVLSRLTLAPILGDEPVEADQPQDNHSGCDASEKVLSAPLDHGLPVIDPVWRGSFEISGDEYGPIAAHISSKACLKVFKAAKALPSFLRMELPSRLDVWPKKFDLSAPTADDIALYLFPDKKREEKSFVGLVNDMIDMDLALKFVFDNSELIIFPSDQLPKFHSSFRGSHYLWGVFRRRTVPVS